MRLTEITSEMIQNPDKVLVERLLFDGFDYGGEKADLIMVLGGRNAVKYRLPRAIELYNSGKANMLLLSGGNVIQTASITGFAGDAVTECEAMCREAVRLQIPEGRIIREGKSANTAENFRFSGEILKECFPECKDIILITSAFHMRRAVLFAEREMSEYNIIPCPVNAGSACKDNWFMTEKGKRHIREEIERLYRYAKDSLIDDIDL